MPLIVSPHLHLAHMPPQNKEQDQREKTMKTRILKEQLNYQNKQLKRKRELVRTKLKRKDPKRTRGQLTIVMILMLDLDLKSSQPATKTPRRVAMPMTLMILTSDK